MGWLHWDGYFVMRCAQDGTTEKMLGSYGVLFTARRAARNIRFSEESRGFDVKVFDMRTGVEWDF